MRALKHIPIVMALLAIPCLAAAASGSFRDVESGTWYEPYVRQAVDAGLVSGYEDATGTPTGLFGPGNPVTVAEMAKITAEAESLESYSDAGSENFPASWKDHWAYEYLVRNASYGKLITNDGKSDDTLVNIDAPATRGQVAQMIGMGYLIPPTQDTWARPFKGYFSDVPKTHPFRVQIEYLAEIGLLTGDVDSSGTPTGKFRPDDPVNRAEAVKIALRARELFAQSPR